MRVLVVGGGGREHALAWKLAQSPHLTALFVAPGNPGMEPLARMVAIAAEDISALVEFARLEAIDLVVVGPEAPLALGLADRLAEVGIACFGPSQRAAQLEASKRFTKEVCDEAGIPTAQWANFTDVSAARTYLATHPAPIVIKADGLAAGKGVVVAETDAEAKAAVTAMLEDGIHGASGAEIVVEECLVGTEVSLFAICDGETALFCGAAADHKRVGENDTGPNTGGMGAIAPPPAATDAMIAEAMSRIVQPALATMARRGAPFRGFLFAGLMLTAEEPKLIEFNVRFGDPECETLMPLLRSDLLSVLAAAAHGRLDAKVPLEWHDGASATVIMATRGYPGDYAKDQPLRLGAAITDTVVFHAGTKRRGDALVSAGGRVLAVNAIGADLRAAVSLAYATVETVSFPGGFYRRDIGKKAL